MKRISRVESLRCGKSLGTGPEGLAMLINRVRREQVDQIANVVAEELFKVLARN